MHLSSRATSYLASLERLQMVPTAKVVEELKRCTVPASKSWVDFQDRFGGYVETIGRDRAIWGLMHVAPEWQEPRGRASVVRLLAHELW